MRSWLERRINRPFPNRERAHGVPASVVLEYSPSGEIGVRFGVRWDNLPPQLTATVAVMIGGEGRNRTDDAAFAEPCLTTWLPRHPVRQQPSSLPRHQQADLTRLPLTTPASPKP